jgi:hypothetical protein
MATNPEFPDVDDSLPLDLPEELEVPGPGEGLVEAAGVPFDEEGERVVQPEPVGD